MPWRDLTDLHHGLRLAAKYPGMAENERRDLERLADVCWNEHVKRCAEKRSIHAAS